MLKKIVPNFLTKLRLRFSNSAVESNYHTLMQPFNDSNFTSFLLLLMAGQFGFMAIKVIEGSISYPILIGVTVIINIFLLRNRKKWYKSLEIIAMVLMVFIYTLGTLDLKNRVEENEKSSGANGGLFIFFEGYLLCLAHQLFLRYFVQYAYLFLFDVGALILRSLIFATLLRAGEFPYPYLVHLFFDLAILHVSYRKEVTVRGLFEQLHNQKEELAKFKSLMVDSMPESIIILDASLNKELFTNKAFRKSMRNTSLIGNFEQDLSKTYIMKESLETLPYSVVLEEIISKNAVVSLYEFLQAGIKGKLFDEGVFIFQGTSTPPDANRTPLGRRTYEIKVFRLSWDGTDALVVILNDITHREMIVALKVSDINKDKVLSSVTHELKTPLNGIQGMIQIMQKKANSSEMQQHLNVCKISADLLLHYINSIWDLQLLRKNKLKLKINKINIRDLVEEIKSLFVYQCQQKGIDIVVNIIESIPRQIYTDRSRLSEVLVHLVSNAVKFTYHGKVTISLKIDEYDRNQICFSVEDTGIGMTESERVKLFKMFGRVDSNSVGTRGVGLGLTTSNGLVLKLGADRGEKGIEVESAHAKGSKFSFCHPLNLLDLMNSNAIQKTHGQEITQQDQDDDAKFYLIVNKADDKSTEGDIILKNSKLEGPKYRFDDEEFDELDELEDVGEELYVDEDLRRFLSLNGLSIVQERIKKYKTRRFGNLFNFGSPDSFKASFLEEEPQLSNRSLIKIPRMISHDTSPENGKLIRKNTGMVTQQFTPFAEKNDTLLDYTESLLKLNSGGISGDDKGLLKNPPDSANIEYHKNVSFNLTSPQSRKLDKYNARINSYRSVTVTEPVAVKLPILVVDDMPFNVMVVKELIEGAGFEVQTAMNGQQAIDKVKEVYAKNNTAFKFILMDLQMPVMDGFEASKALTDMMKNNEIPTIPIIALTANDNEENLEKCLECGMESMLSKPFRASDLNKLLKRFSDSPQSKNLGV